MHRKKAGHREFHSVQCLAPPKKRENGTCPPSHLCCVKGVICGNASIYNNAPACMSLRMRAGASCFRRAAPSAFCWCLVCSRIESAQNSYYFHLVIDPIYGEEAARSLWENRDRSSFPTFWIGTTSAMRSWVHAITIGYPEVGKRYLPLFPHKRNGRFALCDFCRRLLFAY